MNNLMKAEWFRLRRSGNTLKTVIMLFVMAVVFQFVGNDGLEINAYTYFSHASIGFSLSVVIAAAFVGGTFNSNLADYEIMKGTPPMLMILSKTLTVLYLITAFYLLPSMILVKIFDSENLTVSMMILLFLCTVKMAICSMAVCVFFKDAAGAMIFMFMFMFESMPLVLLQNFAGINTAPIASMLTSSQLMMIGNMSKFDMDELSMPLDNSHIEMKIVISLVIVTAIMFSLAYISLKNKWQLNLITEK